MLTDTPTSMSQQQDEQQHPDLLSKRERRALWRKLTDLQRAWVQEYLTNGYNQAQAARDAGYKCSGAAGFAQQGHENRNKPRIITLLNDLFARQLSPREIEAQLAKMNESTVQHFVSVDEKGELTCDLAAALKQGVDLPAERLSFRSDGTVESVKFYGYPQTMKVPRTTS